MGFSARISLVSILTIATTFELVLNRVIVRLVPRPKAAAATKAGIYDAIDSFGLFFFYFVGLLALGLVAWGVVVLIRDRKLLDIASRTVLAIAGALFLPLAALGQVIQLPAAVAPHLNTAFGVFIASLVVITLRRNISLRHKIGIVYLAAPLLLHVYWLLTQQITAIAPVGARADLPSRLFEIGEHMVIVGAFVAFFFFAPLARVRSFFEPIPLAVAIIITGAVGAFAQLRYPVAAQAAYYGLGINLPAPSFQEALHLAALFWFTLTATGLFSRGGAERGLGYGLVLIALSGFQLQLPYQFLLTAAGMLLLLRGALASESEREVEEQRSHASAPKPEQWKRYLERVAEPDDAIEAVVLQNERSHIARLRATRDGRELTVRVIARGAQVEELELTLGSRPRGDAPACLSRRRNRRGHRVPGERGTRVDFDSEYTLRDNTGGVAEALSSPDLREGLARLLHGTLRIWPEEGLRYTTRPLEDGWPLPVAEIAFDPEGAGTEDVQALVALLASIADRTQI
ncbi:MAG: hypothetical protein KC503_15270 [Myxococcales bacterium]|nr:hypothetical protein [Myxococcales bacterium]